MYAYAEEDAMPTLRPERRSFSHNIRSSLDQASARISLSGRSGRRSVSGARSVSALGERQALETHEKDYILATSFGSYSMQQDTSGGSVPDAENNRPLSPEQFDGSPVLSPVPTNGSDLTFIRENRPSSMLSMRDDSSSSLNTSSSKWYKRFNRSGSNNRLSKALETSDAAVMQSAGKLYNPFARRRSVPAFAGKRHPTILGQTTKQAVEIGGHSANASRLLPADLIPEVPVEIPYIADACISWLIENHAHMTPGIFRINGSSQAVKTIVEHFSMGSVRMPLECIELPAKQLISVHDVASCLKKFLVLLPGGLMGDSVFEQLQAISDEAEMIPTQATIKDVVEVLRLISDRQKYNLIVVLFALLHHISRQSITMAQEDEPKQETGYMTAFSLGIIFSPTCLGSRDGAVDMRRTSTSHSDRSVQSDTTPIEEAVAIARQGAKVVQMLIQYWQEIVQHLVMSDCGSSIGDDAVSLLDVVSLSSIGNPQEQRQGLQTILDSPIKSRTYESSGHGRTDSIDTVTVSRKKCSCDDTIMIRDAQIQLLESRIDRLEAERELTSRELARLTAEHANLLSQHEIAKPEQQKQQQQQQQQQQRSRARRILR